MFSLVHMFHLRGHLAFG